MTAAESIFNISRMSVENFRCFEKESFEFANRFNLIVGVNGKGKTALLDSILVGGSVIYDDAPIEYAQKIYQADIRLIPRNSRGLLTFERMTPVTVSCEGHLFGEKWDWSRSMKSQKGRTSSARSRRLIDRSVKEFEDSTTNEVTLPVILYFKAGRLPDPDAFRSKSSRKKKLERFEAYRGATNTYSHLEFILSSLRDMIYIERESSGKLPQLDAIRNALIKCVLGAEKLDYSTAEHSLTFLIDGQWKPIGQLSAGYRSVIRMVGDIAFRYSLLNPHLGEQACQTPGVVLIDELDVHLHPSWQRTIVQSLLEAFPNTQFFATTHSPFIIQSLPEHPDVKLFDLDQAKAGTLRPMNLQEVIKDIQKIEQVDRSESFVQEADYAKHVLLDLAKISEQPNPDLAKLEDISSQLQNKLVSPLTEATLSTRIELIKARAEKLQS